MSKKKELVDERVEVDQSIITQQRAAGHQDTKRIDDQSGLFFSELMSMLNLLKPLLLFGHIQSLERVSRQSFAAGCVTKSSASPASSDRAFAHTHTTYNVTVVGSAVHAASVQVQVGHHFIGISLYLLTLIKRSGSCLSNDDDDDDNDDSGLDCDSHFPLR